MDEALSDAFSGVLVSDFYAAYHHYDGPQQRCWAHLLRDIHDLVALYWPRWADPLATVDLRRGSPSAFTHPEAKDGAPPNWPSPTGPRPALPRCRQPRPSCAGASSATSKNSIVFEAEPAVYVEARSFTHPQAQRRRTAQLAWERQLLVICQPFLADRLALQGRLCRRSERRIKELFVFVAERFCRNAFRQQPRRAQPAPSGHQPQGQRRHPLGAGHRAQDDASIHLRHLSAPKV